jgi:hypothetical protein
VKSVVVLLGLTTGCDLVFRLDQIGPRSDVEPDAEPDAGRISDVPTSCELRQVLDDFEVGSPCSYGVWTIENATMNQRGGALELEFAGGSQAVAVCTAYQEYDLTANGVFLLVEEPLEVANAYTVLTVRAASGHAGATARMQFHAGALMVTLDGDEREVARPVFPMWWRISQPTRGTIAAHVSTDGSAWHLLRERAVPVAEAISVDFGAGIYATPSMPGSAVVGAFGICH